MAQTHGSLVMHIIPLYLISLGHCDSIDVSEPKYRLWEHRGCQTGQVDANLAEMIHESSESGGMSTTCDFRSHIDTNKTWLEVSHTTEIYSAVRGFSA